MLFRPTKLAGVWIVDLERREDERGFFARTWCKDELRAHGLTAELSQCSVSFNAKAGTLRGMHYQVAPKAETKLVSCWRGAIYDVVLDLRPGSPTFRQWLAEELTEDALRAIYIPEGCAHGFQTLKPGVLVQYLIAGTYSPDHARGVRWNDPAFAIEWPPAERMLSKRDATYPDFVP
jgi:dTDP-4-dehydrorhamnose 3,5-epimerase